MLTTVFVRANRPGPLITSRTSALYAFLVFYRRLAATKYEGGAICSESAALLPSVTSPGVVFSGLTSYGEGNRFTLPLSLSLSIFPTIHPFSDFAPAHALARRRRGGNELTSPGSFLRRRVTAGFYY